MTRPVEVFLCWTDHTWSTELVQIPDDTPVDAIEKIAKAQAELIALSVQRQLAFAGVYWIPDLSNEEMGRDDP